MAIKTLNTRIALRYDTYENWSKTEVTDQGANLVLLKGELGICEVPAVNADSNVAPTVLFKVGDGTKKFSELPWASAKAADVYSWAKASDVVVDGKTIKFVGGAIDSDGKKIDKVITLNFATPQEVEAVRAGLDSRITAIETSIGNGGNIAGQVADLTGRVGTAEQNITDLGNDKLDKSVYEEYIAGKEMSDAAIKEYADGKASAAQAAAEGTASAALAVVKGDLVAADDALGGRIDGVSNRVAAFEGENGLVATGDAATLASAKSYAESQASAAQTAAQGYADSVAATAKSEATNAANTYTDGKVAVLNAKDDELAGLIGGNTTAINNEVTARGQAIDAINTKIGTVTEGKDVVTMISDAQTAAEANAATTAQGKVDALANGQVETNRAAIATLSGTVSSEITRVEGLVTAEAAKAREEEGKLNTRLEEVEAFFHTAEDETLDTALDTLKEIQDYLNGEGTATDGIIGRVAKAETDIDNLEKEFAEGGRVKIAEGAIIELRAKDTELETAIGTKLATDTFNGHVNSDHAKTATEITAEIAAAVKVEEDARKLADKAITDSIGSVTEGKTVVGMIGEVSTVANRADATSTDNASRLTTAEGKITALETESAKHAEKTYVDTELAKKVNVSDYETYQGTVTSAINDRYTKTEADGKFALASVVATNSTNISNNAADITSLTSRVGVNETGIADLVTLTGTHTTDIAALQELTKDGGVIRTAIATAQSAAETAQAAAEAAQSTANTNATNIQGLDSRLTAVETDYVKASDFILDAYIFNCGSSTTVTHKN